MNKVPSPTEDLIEDLKDAEFKKEYGAELAKLEFATALHDARTQAKLTQQQLAGLLGRTQPYIARLEGGEANPTLAAIGRMLAALDLKVVFETMPIKPELTIVLGMPCVAAGGAPNITFVNASGEMVFVTEVRSAYQRMAQDWITVTGRPTFGVQLASAALPASSVAATV